MKRSTERTEAVERSAPATARVRLRDERGVARAVRVAERDPGEAVALLQRLAPLLPRLGGSRAQRRIFTWVERDAARRIARARGDVA
jgi:hypothetical protein